MMVLLILVDYIYCIIIGFISITEYTLILEYWCLLFSPNDSRAQCICLELLPPKKVGKETTISYDTAINHYRLILNEFNFYTSIYTILVKNNRNKE